MCSALTKRIEKAKPMQERAIKQHEDAQKLYSDSLRVASSIGSIVDAVDPDRVKVISHLVQP